MRLVSPISICVILLLCFFNTFAQSVVTFDHQQWKSDQSLPKSFSVDNLNFSCDQFYYTNYGYNFNINGTSRYYLLQHTESDKITITTPNREPADLISLAAYRVSETSTDRLVIEGRNGNGLLYTRSFPKDTACETLTLNYNKINKIVIRLDSMGSGGLTGYNFENITLGIAG